jgi:hypothetical protein
LATKQGVPETANRHIYQIENYNYNPGSGWDWPTIIEALSTLALVGFAGWQMGFIRQTTRATRDAADAARENAIAAKEAANATVQHAEFVAQIERPWLIVKGLDPIGWPFDMQVRSVGSKERLFLGVVFGSSVENVGKSPAFLIQQWINVAIVPFPIPEPPEYGKSERFAEMIIPSGGTHAQQRWAQITDPEYLALIAGEKCIIFYGFVKYYGVTRKEPPHETRFCCYWYHLKDDAPQKWKFMPVGPPSFIEYT